MRIHWILLPFSWLYEQITNFRNYLYDSGFLKSYKAPVPVISIGNLTAGGTGKTPHAEYLIRFLLNTFPDKKIAILSRGYGRKTTGFILADETANARIIGDEPMQFFRKFGNDISVAVCEKRPLGIQKILSVRPQTKIILLDDAFQHRPVQPDLNILLTDYNRMFYQDFPFPAGRLRESRYGAKRADCVIVTKTPFPSGGTGRGFLQYTRPNIPVFFTSIRYGTPVSFKKQSNYPDFIPESSNLLTGKILLVSGIAHTQALEVYVSQKFNLIKHLIFSDHYFYTDTDIIKIKNTFQSEKADCVLTTEKDFVKLIDLVLPEEIPFFYLPIEIFFREDENDFLHLITAKI